jgi:ribosomal protein L32E
LHPSGLGEVLIWRPEDLSGVNPSISVVRIAHTVGENKRIKIIEEAKKWNIRILNPGVKREAVEAKAEEDGVKADAAEAERTETPETADEDTEEKKR